MGPSLARTYKALRGLAAPVAWRANRPFMSRQTTISRILLLYRLIPAYLTPNAHIVARPIQPAFTGGGAIFVFCIYKGGSLRRFQREWGKCEWVLVTEPEQTQDHMPRDNKWIIHACPFPYVRLLSFTPLQPWDQYDLSAIRPVQTSVPLARHVRIKKSKFPHKRRP